MLQENQTQSTINGFFGTRVWLYPREIRGLFYKYRSYVSVALLIFYLAVPWIKLGGDPIFILDVLQRKMVLFGTSYWPQDIRVFLPLIVASVFFVVAVTSIFGRIWCGWACPQTVFLHFFFEPIERLVEGKALKRKKRDDGPWNFDKLWRKAVKHGLFLLFSSIIANTFLAYFWGMDNVLKAISGSPAEHPVAFGVMVADSILFYAIFAWFKEQACIIVCPYARFQSALYDEKTMIVGYDEGRGEPRKVRGKMARVVKSFESTVTAIASSDNLASGKIPGANDSTATAAHGIPEGDCVNCGFCVKVCPTGIDIRDGMQLECIGCAKCIDACDSIMAAHKKPPGLIRYSSLDNFSGKTHGHFTTRFWVYSSLISILLVVFVFLISGYKSLSADLTRYGTVPYFEVEEGLSNVYTLRVRNKQSNAITLEVEVLEPSDAFLAGGAPRVEIASGELKSVPVNIQIPRKAIEGGKTHLILGVRGGDETLEVQNILLGPAGPGK